MNQTGHQSSHDTDDYDFHDAQNQALEYTGRHQRQERRAEQYTDPEGVQQQGANDFCHPVSYTHLTLPTTSRV